MINFGDKALYKQNLYWRRIYPLPCTGFVLSFLSSLVKHLIGNVSAAFIRSLSCAEKKSLIRMTLNFQLSKIIFQQFSCKSFE